VLARVKGRCYIGAMTGKNWTWQKLIDERMTMTAFCHNHACNHRQKLDLAMLRDRFGPGCAGNGVGCAAEAALRALRRRQGRPQLYARHQADGRHQHLC
jgi:hypothetical protein